MDPANITAPIPVVFPRLRWRDTFHSLRLHNYRLYFASYLLAGVGAWMSRIAIDWIMLELTGSLTLLGVLVALQFGPTVLLGPWAGVLSDRYSRRRILIITQTAATVSVATLAVLVLGGFVQAWHLFALAGFTGIVGSIDAPSRSAFVTEMVGIARIRNAISLNSVVLQLSSLVGPVLSGVLIATVGAGWAISVNVVTAAICVLAFALMRPHELMAVPPRPRGMAKIGEALKYAARKPTIVWPLVLLVFVSIFGMNLALLFAATANQVYDTGAAGYGFYASLGAVGALVGAVLSTRRRSIRLRFLVFAIIAFGISLIVAGLAPVYLVFLVMVVAVGMSRVFFDTGVESMIQLSVNPGIRGRVLSFYILVMTGGIAVGAIMLGVIAENLGTAVAFAVAGGVPMIAAIVVALVLARRHQLRIRVDLRRPRRLVQIVPRGQIVADL